VSEAIHRVLKESNVLDLKDLCIEEGKAVWSLWVDVVCVSYDGNIYDAALTSVMAALGNGKEAQRLSSRDFAWNSMHNAKLSYSINFP
jgi:exosome complex RNA-binding protein Rrp42 (RNase PH superfamily)